jgi:hypothetical protein
VSLENNQQVKSDDNQEHSTKVDNSRRSFAKKSAAIAPVIMTLANRSAWGAGANACVGTAFGSYSTAVAKPSHSSYQAISGWRQPKRAMPLDRDGWFEAPNDWPSGFKPVHLSGSNAYTSPIGAWALTKTKRQVIGNSQGIYPANSGVIVFVYQLGGLYSSFDNTVTIYDALGAGGNLAYELAGFINQASTPSIPFPPLGPSDYSTFYANCAV